jgi:hypothetical protein
MSVKYDSSTPHGVESFIRSAVTSVNGIVHSLDIIPHLEGDEEEEYEDDFLILGNFTLGDYTSWSIITISDVFENLENNYFDQNVPVVLVQKIGMYLIHSEHKYCDECLEPICGIVYEDVERTIEKIKDDVTVICHGCINIRTHQHTDDHTLEQGKSSESLCDFCMRDLNNTPFYLCRDCDRELTSHDLCEKCYARDESNIRREFRIYYSGSSKALTIEDIYHELECEKAYWTDYDWRPVLARYLTQQYQHQV